MPSKKQIAQEIIKQIHEQLEAAGHGERRAVAASWAEKLGVSVSTVYAKVKAHFGAKKKIERAPKVPTRIVVKIGQMKAKAMLQGRHERTLRTSDCIRILEESGEIEKGSVSRSTVDARLRKMGWNEKRAYQRHEPDHVNQVHMLDFSVSDYVAVVGRKGADDYELALQKGNFSSYKNKEDLGNLKLWLCSIIDTYSRLPVLQYRVSPGENLTMAADFLNYVYREAEDHSGEVDSLTGLYLPDRLELDRGSLGRSKDFYSAMQDSLGVEVRKMSAKADRHGKHQAGGKVERQFRTYWQTENYFSYVLQRKGIERITLSELNVMLYDECLALAQKQHPTRREHSRLDVYESGLQKRTQLYNQEKVTYPNRAFDGDFYDLFFQTLTRKADASGLLSIDNVYYEISDKRFISETITIKENQHGEMVGECGDPLSGEVVRFPITKFDPDAAKPARPKQHLRQKLADMEDDTDYSNVSLKRSADPDEEAPRVHRMQQRQEEAPESPFDTSASDEMMSYEDAREYITDLTGMSWGEIPDSIKRLVSLAWENKQLDTQLLDDLAATLAS